MGRLPWAWQPPVGKGPWACPGLIAWDQHRLSAAPWPDACRRTTAFGAFGLLYLGGVQYYIYVPLFSRLFPNAASFAGEG